MSANRGVKVVLHSLERSRAQRIVWLMEELNLSYEFKIYKRGVNDVAPPEMKQIHPLGKSPIISIQAPNAPKRVLAESAVIMEYLLDHFQGQKLVPKRYVNGQEGQPGGETEAWMRYRHYMHYTESSLFPLLVMQLVMNMVKNAPAPFFIKPVLGLVPNIVQKEYCQPNFDTYFGFLENQLATSPDKGEYLTGSQFTAADILMSYPIFVALSVGVISKGKYPRIYAYADCLRTFETYKRSVKTIEAAEGQPYRLF